MTTELIDQPKAVREEDRLETSAIVAWLQAALPDEAPGSDRVADNINDDATGFCDSLGCHDAFLL